MLPEEAGRDGSPKFDPSRANERTRRVVAALYDLKAAWYPVRDLANELSQRFDLTPQWCREVLRWLSRDGVFTWMTRDRQQPLVYIDPVSLQVALDFDPTVFDAVQLETPIYALKRRRW